VETLKYRITVLTVTVGYRLYYEYDNGRITYIRLFVTKT